MVISSCLPSLDAPDTTPATQYGVSLGGDQTCVRDTYPARWAHASHHSRSTRSVARFSKLEDNGVTVGRGGAGKLSSAQEEFSG